ncbi:polysaccharide biosynthesis protein [Pseudomonas corrugata]|uniref:hypothetical protein n=1 Tax=Pseudomonas corrugata TaxID=47879 RepID=UPI002233F0DF|nr:hypothetical protein [Pseudomonas corrugata]UZE07937.1 hypothetical protein LOY65_08490 [Pseudomonas corrugata]
MIKLLRLIASSGTAQAILFAANFCLVFFYDAETIAAYGFYITVGSLFSVLSSVRLDYFAFFSRTNDQAREVILSIGFSFVVISMLGLVLVSFFWGGLSLSTLYLALSIFCFSFYYLSSQCSLMVKDYPGYGRSRIILGLTFLFFSAVMAAKGLLGLLLSYCFAQVIASIYLWRRNDFQLRLDIQTLKYGAFFRIKERLLNSFSTGIQFLSPALPIIMGSYFFNLEALGAFFWVSQMLGAAAAIIKRSLMGYLSAELMYDGKLKKVTVDLSVKVLLGGLVVSVLGCFVIFSCSHYVAEFVPSWDGYIKFLPALVLLYGADALVQPLGSLLSSIHREKTHLLIELGRLVFVLVCFMLVVGFDLDIYWFVWAFSIVMATFYFLGGGIFCYATRSEMVLK